MSDGATRERGLFITLVGDGRPLLFAVAGALVFAGGFAIFLAVGGELLPHDSAFLDMTAGEVCAIADCRLFAFMVHDRVAWGGSLIGLGILYAWIVAFPLAEGESWAWWVLASSGLVGFLTFLAYLGYGYLDTWHGIGTLLLLPVFVGGMYRTRTLTDGRGISVLVKPGAWLGERSPRAWGRLALIAGALATAAGGILILRVGIGDTFVPEDLAYIGLERADLDAINPRLVPLLAHDRAGFGGGVLTMGLTTALCLWCSDFRRSFWQAIACAGGVSLAAALTVHFAVGYTDLWHLAPALVASAALATGLALERIGPPSATDPSA